MKKLSRLLRQATPEIIGTIVGGLLLAVAVAMIGKLADVGVLPVIVIIVGCVWTGCAYLAFKRTKPLIPGGKGVWQYPRWRPWALAGMVVILLVTAGGGGYYCYQKARPPSKIIILIADFEGPETQKYRVTETVLNRMRQALKPYDDVEITTLGRAITESEGSAVAHTEGEKRNAAIVIWGWYGMTAETVPLSVHFEVLRPPQYLPELAPEAKGQVQVLSVAGLDSFTLQPRLSAEMAYLSLFTVGVVRYAAEDWDGAIARFNDALSQTVERIPALDRSIVYFQRGTAYYYKGEYDRAIADLDQAIALHPDLAMAYSNRGIAYAHKGEYDQAIEDFDQAIELQPDYAQAYNNRGNAYAHKGEYDRAIEDYDQAIALQPDYAEAYNNRGNAYAHKGEYDRAIEDYDQAIELQPDYAKAYNNRGIAYAHKGEYDKAIKDFRKVVEVSDNPAVRQSAEEQLRELGASP